MSATPGEHQFYGYKDCQRKQPYSEETYHSTRPPAIGAGRRKRVEYCREPEGYEYKPDKVKASLSLRAVFAQQKDREEDGKDAYRNVDVEDQLPACISYQVSSQRWAKRGSKQGGNAEDAHGYPTFLRRELAEHERDGKREERCSTKPLDNAERDENG